jgi:hypothetical protein
MAHRLVPHLTPPPPTGLYQPWVSCALHAGVRAGRPSGSIASVQRSRAGPRFLLHGSIQLSLHRARDACGRLPELLIGPALQRDPGRLEVPRAGRPLLRHHRGTLSGVGDSPPTDDSISVVGRRTAFQSFGLQTPCAATAAAEDQLTNPAWRYRRALAAEAVLPYRFFPSANRLTALSIRR